MLKAKRTHTDQKKDTKNKKDMQSQIYLGDKSKEIMTHMKKTQDKIREQVGYKFPIPKPPLKRQIYVINSKSEVKVRDKIEVRDYERSGTVTKEEMKQTTIEKYIASKT